MLSGHRFVGILFFKNAVYLPKFPGNVFFFFLVLHYFNEKKKRDIF